MAQLVWTRFRAPALAARVGRAFVYPGVKITVVCEIEHTYTGPMPKQKTNIHARQLLCGLLLVQLKPQGGLLLPSKVGLSGSVIHMPTRATPTQKRTLEIIECCLCSYAKHVHVNSVRM